MSVLVKHKLKIYKSIYRLKINKSIYRLKSTLELFVLLNKNILFLHYRSRFSYDLSV